MWKDIVPLSYSDMWRSLSFVLYHEKTSRFVSFGELDNLEKEIKAT